MKQGLVTGEGFATDASVIEADTHWKNSASYSEAQKQLASKQNSRLAREYIDALDAQNKDIATPKTISLSDPQARWTAITGGLAYFAYSTNYLIDIGHNIIVDVEPTPAHRSLEVDSTKHMLNRVEQRHGLKPKRLIGDTAYGVAPMLDWMVQEKGIEPHVPVWDKTDTNPNVFPRSEFRWNANEDNYQCPGGKLLQPRRRNFKNHRAKTITKENTVIYRASQNDCKGCELKSQCCPNTVAKKIARSIYEDSREIARAISQTPEYRQSRNDRKKVEVLFAHLKRIMKLDRLRLRGLSGAHDEFVMAATAQNLRRMAKLLHKPPDDRIVAPA